MERLRACQIPESLSKKSLTPSDINTAISYAAYRLILARYHESPGYIDTVDRANSLMNQYGYDTSLSSSNMRIDTRASTIGNAAANCYLTYGRSDGSNESGKTEIDDEVGSYANQYYTPLNPDLDPNAPGDTNIIDMNRWQPIALQNFVDQAGNPITGGAAKFIGAEWGNVAPFALRADQKTTHTRDDHEYHAYLDPGLPPQSVSGEAGVALATPTDTITPKKDTKIDNSLYAWNYALVGIWSSHLDPRDGVMIDISPTSLGNIAPLPTTFEAMRDYYDLKNGGVKTLGRSINPKTGLPYQKELVPRGDYTRAIAEFWADGPKSETPPGHWFTILNDVSDRIPQKRIGGTGAVIDDLEWDVKSYFALGGALHDAGIAAWGIKGSYDEVRPISAIRAMASHGQSSDPTLPSYDIQGLPLISGAIELVRAGDPLEGKTGQNIGKVKMRAWKGPKYISSPEIDMAGSDWILAENWWPYQRPSFVTPPFAGYVSGHSTFSHAAAELLTELTGDPYFPGGLHETPLRANRYLVFEQGPSRDITLQWATYLDAANESSLSRIWGGIHPPMDDIPGRRIGIQIGTQAYTLARSYFGGR